MELLHGKAKEDYFSQSNYSESIFKELPILYQNALIINFLDSIGLKIGIEPLIDSSFRSFVLGYDNLHQWIDNRFDSRKEATTEAIKKAVEIFNEKHI